VKKQYKTYLLLSIVLIVWGLIGYRLIKAVNPSVEPQNTLLIDEKFIPQKIADRERFTIVADYRDPFLGTIKTKEQNAKKKTAKPVKKEIPTKEISYTGFIIDKDSDEKIFFVKIDGQQQMMSLKNTVNEVTLLQGTKSFIRISYGGISKKIILE
jgi:hypothetical protein